MHDGFDGVGWVVYTLPDSNIHSGINKHSWLEHGPGLKMYFLMLFFRFFLSAALLLLACSVRAVRNTPETSHIYNTQTPQDDHAQEAQKEREQREKEQREKAPICDAAAKEKKSLVEHRVNSFFLEAVAIGVEDV